MLAKKFYRVCGLSWCQWRDAVRYWASLQHQYPHNNNNNNNNAVKTSLPLSLSSRLLASQPTTSNEVNSSHITSSESSSSTGSELQDEDLSEKGIGRFQEEQNCKLRLTPDHPADSRVLRAAIIGLPNSGKSTLTNALMGWRVSSVSKKVHTTRKNTLAVRTHGNTQIVFLDTPGILSATSRKKHNLERSLLIDPERSLYQAHLVCVMVDVSNRWTKNDLDPLVLQALHLHRHIPAVLVLNKVDLVHSKPMLLQIARSLTQGIVDGRPMGISTKKSARKQGGQPPQLEALFDAMDQSSSERSSSPHGDSLQDELFPTAEEGEEAEHENDPPTDCDQPLREETQPPTNASGAVASEDEAWQSYFRRMRVARRAVRGMKGWPLFKRVLMVSALSGDGVQGLQDYLLDSAVPGDWDYHSSLVTAQDPRELVLLCVREKLLEHLKHEVPYSIALEIVLWEVDEDGMFNVIINAKAQSKRQVKMLLGPKGSTIQKIASEAKQEMMNAFRCEMRLKLVAICRPKQRSK